MALRTKSEVFAATDGILGIVSRGDAWAIRGAKWDSAGVYEVGYTAPFASSQLRYSDSVMLGDDVSNVTRKVRARIPPDVDTDSFAAIGGKVYDLTRIDRDGRLAWLYLSEVKAEGQCSLLGYTVTYDDLGLATRTATETPVWYKTATYGSTTDEPPMPSVTIQIRNVDYAGEREVRVGSTKYAIQSTTGDGQWLSLTCAEGGAQVE